ncbi:MAG: hypothetical protein V4502_04050 [Pseudomonadota bacterium]
MGQIQAFEQLLYRHLIPEFCADQRRRCTLQGFRNDSVKVSENDAGDFLRAWDGGLLTHKGRGLYRAAVSSASEQFFWEGPKESKLRWFSLWLEPVITIAALARLHFDHGWPTDLLGTQSTNWAFDLVALSGPGDSELIAGEVKKTAKEVETLLLRMAQFGYNPDAPCPAAGKERNAFKKVAALRTGRAPLFWAIGPDRLSKAYRVTYVSEVVNLTAVEEAELSYSRCAGLCGA